MMDVEFSLPLRSLSPWGRFWALAILAIGCTLPLVGCGETSAGDRIPLEGTVTIWGEPLTDKATIYFDPVEGQGGIGSSGEVKAGRFTIPAESGPTPGLKYNVKVITAPGIPADGTPPDQIKLPATLETVVEIPPRGEGEDEIVIAFE